MLIQMNLSEEEIPVLNYKKNREDNPTDFKYLRSKHIPTPHKV
jgi:hypothetical protein